MPKPKTANRAIDIGISTAERARIAQGLSALEKTAWMLRSLLEV